MLCKPTGKVVIIQGGQYGSEAKGAIADYLAWHPNAYNFSTAVRTGAINAGHTVIRDGNTYVFQQIPVASLNPNIKVCLGAGAMVNIDQLDREMLMVRVAAGGIDDRLFIDRNAGMHGSRHTERSAVSGRHIAMGATGKGCSEAVIDKISGRGTGYQTAGGILPTGIIHPCVAELLNDELEKGNDVMLEGTQGTLLDLNLGPYPYVTHKPTSPAAWLAEAGLSPSLNIETVMVVRTFPIRVAGNSGPLPDEISWPMLTERIAEERFEKGLERVTPSDAAIRAFEEAVASSSRSRPPQYGHLTQHVWPDELRTVYAESLSKVNAEAIASLSDLHRMELSRLFEMTTVTKKLRRIAELNLDELRKAAMICRPTYIAITFMNYLFPEWWYRVPDRITPEMSQFIIEVSKTCDAPVRWLSFGPASEHIIEI